ncbi:MAG: hypothetical protein ACU4EQ_03325 [Candidatus Nitrosoglobus sp.]|jgi:hypothetical protein
MTVIIQEIYTAFKEAGVSEETATNAAKSIANYEDKFNEIEKRFNKVDLQIMEVKGILRLHQWMLGFLVAMMIAVLFLLLRLSI